MTITTATSSRSFTIRSSITLRRLRVERRARLVEQQHLGVGGQRAGDAQPLLLAAGEPQRRVVEVVRRPRRAGPARVQRVLARRPGAPPGAAAAWPARAARRRRCRTRSSGTGSAAGRPSSPGGAERSARASAMSIPSSVIRPVSDRRLGQLGEPVERAQQRRLAAPDGPISASTSPWRIGSETELTASLRAVGDRQALPPACGRSRTATRVRRRGALTKRGAPGGRCRQPSLAAGIAAGRLPPARRPRRSTGGAGGSGGGPGAVCLSSIAAPSSRGRNVDHDVERQHDQQQHERRRVGLSGWLRSPVGALSKM